MNSGISVGRHSTSSLAHDGLEDAAADHADRLAREVERHRHHQTLRQVDLVEVGVERPSGDRMALQLAQQDHALVQLRVSARADEADQMRALEVADAALELDVVDADARGRALRTVDHGGNATGDAQPPRRALSAAGAALDGNLDGFHTTFLRRSIRRTGS